MPTEHTNPRRRTPWSVASLGRALDTHRDRGVVKTWRYHHEHKGAPYSITMHDGETFEFTAAQCYAFVCALASTHRYAVRLMRGMAGTVPTSSVEPLWRFIGERRVVDETDLDDAIARAERYGEPIPGAVDESTP